MIFIKDLGMRVVGLNGNKARFGLYKCPSCSNDYERETSKVKMTNQKTCFSCCERTLTHGMSKTKIYRVWCGMRERCNNKNHISYKKYGGRGIKVCKEWLESFEAFYADMGDMPKKGMQVDREDNDGNYEPSNCKWATRIENMRNSSATKLNKNDVLKIKKLLLIGKHTNTYIANMFNVNQEAISKIKNGRTWVDVNI